MLLIQGGIYAQESKVSFGMGGEINGGAAVEDTKVYEAGGGWTGSAEYRFTNLFAGGIKLGVTNDFKYRITVFEQSIFARLYFVRLKKVDIFAEAGPGGLIVMRTSGVSASLEAYLIAGARISFGNWYVEPYIGTGYPLWGRIGAMIGYRVPAPQPAVVQAPQPAISRPDPRAAESTSNQRQQPLSEEQTSSAPSQSQIAVIIFPANRMDFTGLNAETVEANAKSITDMGNILKAHPEYRAVLEGHANPTEGTEEEELYELIPLSRQRAEVVAEMLVRAGVNRKQLIIAGSGGVVPSTTGEKNRRVEITVIHN